MYVSFEIDQNFGVFYELGIMYIKNPNFQIHELECFWVNYSDFHLLNFRSHRVVFEV